MRLRPRSVSSYLRLSWSFLPWDVGTSGRARREQPTKSWSPNNPGVENHGLCFELFLGRNKGFDKIHDGLLDLYKWHHIYRTPLLLKKNPCLIVRPLIGPPEAVVSCFCTCAGCCLEYLWISDHSCFTLGSLAFINKLCVSTRQKTEVYKENGN